MLDTLIDHILLGTRTPEQLARQLGTPTEAVEGFSIKPTDTRWKEMFLAKAEAKGQVAYLRLTPERADALIWHQLREQLGSGTSLPAETPGTHLVVFKIDRSEYPAIGRVFITLNKPREEKDAAILSVLIRRDPRR